MKSVIAPCRIACSYVQEFFPERSLASLPLAGKSYGEYLLDLSFMLKCSDALVLDYDFVPAYHEHLTQGERWGMPVQYTGSGLLPELNELLHMHRTFIGNEPCLIFFGAVMPDIMRAEELLERAVPAESLSDDGVYLLRDGTFFRCDVPLRQMDTLNAFYQLNFHLLENPGVYVLRGYSAEKHIYIGEDVEIMTDMLQPPLMLCDHCSISRNCVLKDAVIGRNSIVEAGTEIYRSILFDNVFVGGNMELNGKIVYLNRIIDPVNGVFFQADCEIASGKRLSDVPVAMVITSRIAALVLALLALPFWRISGLSTRRYMVLWQAVLGQAELIHEMGHDKPFVFRASDAVVRPCDEAQQRLDDLYFGYHRSLWMIMRIVFKSLVNSMAGKDEH